MQHFRETAKRSAGWLAGRYNRNLQYRNCIMILAHMRCGSTALSNILCSRADVSGYGETHVRHDGAGALGRLSVNLRRRGGWSPGGSLLFDKILHNRHDHAAPDPFFDARAIFVVRRPGDAVRSIVDLYAKLGRDEYATHEQATVYYIARLQALRAMWARFAAERRIGITHEGLVASPDKILADISARLGFQPPLANHYVSPAASRLGGGGDPLVSAKHDRIIADSTVAQRPDAVIDSSAELLMEANRIYRDMVHLFEC